MKIRSNLIRKFSLAVAGAVSWVGTATAFAGNFCECSFANNDNPPQRKTVKCEIEQSGGLWGCATEIRTDGFGNNQLYVAGKREGGGACETLENVSGNQWRAVNFCTTHES